MKIKKNLLSAEELAQFEALVAKATVAPDAAEEDAKDEAMLLEVEDEKTEKSDGVGKSAEAAMMDAAMARLEALEKSIEMKECTEVAKRFAVLGEKEEELAKTIYDLKKSNPDALRKYLEVLEKSAGIVEKSGLFTEIGKSGGAGSPGGAVAKVEAVAAELRKSDPSLTHDQAITKAWETRADLRAEYDAEYRG